ncbi:tRNA pseudouridine(38-40) synthase TruA [Aquibacillus halophilus]|uniref:tRNA pseudouridine synthase A n=1 Tax=Aquibacillus halophilus TaxID=930132 RepID=A0A6A8DK58_9BACI|nr:tRNA pseudouridine(38-40) synthase TruA [Aquibacillus halophilus]
MNRIKCTISYDGTHFSGYQVQPNGRTVQQEFEKALSKLHKDEVIRIIASGRTDAGVHAKGQVIHFDTWLNIPIKNWPRALNAVLPDDIRVIDSEEVAQEFHARYNVREKEYRYFILNKREHDVFTRNYTCHVIKQLDVEAMIRACESMKGEHDFTSFCAANSGVKGDKIRTIYHATCYQEGNRIVFIVKGNGFLYNMVRILAGTLIEIGKHDRPITDIKRILDAKNRGDAGRTAPAQGLFLWDVVYNN